jgi:hypothetical protein
MPRTKAAPLAQGPRCLGRPRITDLRAVVDAIQCIAAIDHQRSLQPGIFRPSPQPSAISTPKEPGAFAHGEPSDRAYTQACMTMRRRQIVPRATVYPRGCGGLL